MKKTVLHSGVVLFLAGLVLVGSSCRTGFPFRAKPGGEKKKITAVPEAQPLVEMEVAKTEPAAVEQPAAVSKAAPAKQPWYKRLWPRHEKARQPGEVTSPLPAPIKPKETPAVAKAEPVRKTSRAPWYRRLWPAKAKPGKAGKSVPEAESSEPPAVLPPESNAMFSDSGEPLIKVGFVLKLSISAGGKVEVPEQAKTVSDKGSIMMPLVGEIPCIGLTLKELSDKLSKTYGQYIRDPQVAVDFVYLQGELSPWGSVAVLGMVRQQGRVNIPPTRNLTLSRAIQLAGGMEKSANEQAIIVSRPQKSGKPRRIVINMLDVARLGQIENDIVLESGDVVYVQESVW